MELLCWIVYNLRDACVNVADLNPKQEGVGWAEYQQPMEFSQRRRGEGAV